MKVTTIVAAVTSAGTPVRFTTDEALRADRIDFFPKVGNTKRTVVGLAGLNKSTLASVIRELGKVAVDTNPDAFTVESTSGATSRLADFWCDADLSGESVVMVAYQD